MASSRGWVCSLPVPSGPVECLQLALVREGLLPHLLPPLIADGSA